MKELTVSEVRHGSECIDGNAEVNTIYIKSSTQAKSFCVILIFAGGGWIFPYDGN